MRTSFRSSQGSGLYIDQPSGDVAPVRLGANTLYTGFYATDTFNVTPRLSVTAGGRFNIAQIGLTDEIGNDPGLNGSHVYSRFNPTLGATYKVTPNVTVYGELCGSEPGADAIGARLRRSDAAVSDRQRARRRSQSQSGRVAHLRGRRARAFRRRQRGVQLERRRLPRAQHQRHSLGRQSNPGPRIFPECRQYAPSRHRGPSLVQAGSLDRLCQFHLPSMRRSATR